MTDAQAGASGTAEAPGIDVWSFANEKSLDLGTMFRLKDAVLLHKSLKNKVLKGLDDVSESDQPRNAGIARWLLAQYHRAHPLLRQAGGSDPTIDFMIAECCLRAE